MKKKRLHQIGVRLTDDEYEDLMHKITDLDGNQMMTPSTFARASMKGAAVRIVDTELEQYRTFVAAQMANARNQMVNRLNIESKAGIISEKTYVEILELMRDQDHELNRLLEPLK